MDCNFKCCVKVERHFFNPVRCASSKKQKTIFSSTKSLVKLYRDDNRSIYLNLTDNGSQFNFDVSAAKLHHKFAEEGKLTLSIDSSFKNKYTTYIMLSDIAKIYSSLFVRFFLVKQTVLKSKGFLKKTSSSSNSLYNISPVSTEDLKQVKGLGKFSKNLFAPDLTKKLRSYSFDTFEGDEQLSETQKIILRQVTSKSAPNVFITGGAGTGKSFLLKQIIKHLPSESTFVTASTGVAAANIGGCTIHSFSGLYNENFSMERIVGTVKKRPYIDFWRKVSILIVDEVSMVSARYFSMLDKIARVIKKRDVPFGGIQLILCGDFFQLPPIVEKNENVGKLFCFQSRAWLNANIKKFELIENFRQETNNDYFVSFLKKLRTAEVTDDCINEFNERVANNKIESENTVVLCTHKSEANNINNEKLNNLVNKEERVYTAVDSVVDACISSSSSESEKYNNLAIVQNSSQQEVTSFLDHHLLVPCVTKLKVGTRVMLKSNLDTTNRLSNGSCGVVVGFEKGTDLPLVKFDSVAEPMVIGKKRFQVRRSSNVVYVRLQVPLVLAWAFSIHKSQGLSLDNVRVNLSNVFCSGQAYVALSRVRSFERLVCYGLSRDCVCAEEAVKRFYK